MPPRQVRGEATPAGRALRKLRGLVADKKSGSDRTDKWTVALTVVSLMAGGIVFAGVVDRWSGADSGELTASSVEATQSTAEMQAEENSEYTYVTPTVVYPTSIPGCTSVESPGDGLSSISYWASGAQTYDDPRFPWFSGPKATVMSEAVQRSLPASAVIEFASPERSLNFGPLHVPSESSELPEGFSLEEMADTTAAATLVRDGKVGALSIRVTSHTGPVPPCIAGSLIERRTLTDGSVVDAQDTWSETNGVRTLSRSALLYGADRTFIQASATDAVYSGSPGVEISGMVPLTVEELIALVSLPQLRITAPVPPGTAPIQPGCQGSTLDPSGRKLDRGTVDELGRALQSGWRAAPPGMPALEPALGTLVLAESDTTTACQDLVARSGGNESDLSVSITSGQPLPKAPNKYDPSYDGHPKSVVTAEDGAVIVRDEDSYSVMPMGNGEGTREATSKQSRSVALTRPDGTRVSVRSSAASSNEPMTFEQLEFLATIDGLEIR
ncbi:hypothetical protein [Rhodococcus sp. 24CO]|uniref:hypothetical protein n=1 Tax=Rhodococcus sp. 24CO TaxID=3117460 RepID=UPI003D326B55